MRQRIVEYAVAHLTPESITPTLACDAQLPLDQISTALYAAIERLQPYGMDNEEPLFVARNVLVTGEVRVLKERHIKVKLATGDGDSTISALAWRWADRFAELGIAEGSRIDIAYRLRHNRHPDFGGIELEIEDLKLA